jgi:hypothetical protein
MFPALLLGTALLIACVILNSLAVAGIIRVVAVMLRRGYAETVFWKNATVVLVTALITTVAHLFLMALWALVFLQFGEFKSFGQAFYHSAVNYTTLGYGDIVMSAPWRLLGPLEALTGVLMLGISTALMFAVITRLVERRLKWKQASDEPSTRRPSL